MTRKIKYLSIAFAIACLLSTQSYAAPISAAKKNTPIKTVKKPTKKTVAKKVPAICSVHIMFYETCCDGTRWTVGWYNEAWWCDNGTPFALDYYFPEESACWYDCV